MEAKDTTIKLGETYNVSLKVMMEGILLQQAEISFKAGRESGYSSGFVDGQNDLFQANGMLANKISGAKQAGELEGMRKAIKWFMSTPAGDYMGEDRLKSQCKIWFAGHPEILKELGIE